MQSYDIGKLRNVALLSHGGAGKTSLAEAMLYSCGTISRQGKVTDGNTVADFDPEEVKRQISINLSLLPCEWNKHKVNIIDTPGYADFVGEVMASLRASDCAVVVVCAADGVEVGTEQVWRHLETQNLPRMVFINKMDRENADFMRTLNQIQTILSRKCVALQIPIGSKNTFEGIVDLVAMKAYTGIAMEEAEIPNAMLEQVGAIREKILETVAELDDDLTTKYLEGEELTPEELYGGLREGVKSGNIIPVLTGCGLQNIGVTTLLNSLCEYMPSPKDCGAVKGKEVSTIGEVLLSPDVETDLAALVFKTTADPYVGKLTYFRVYSGVIKSNSQVWNAGRNAEERFGQLFMVRGKSQEPIAQATAGDIGAVAKLTVTNTGDTLTSKEHPVILPSVDFPTPPLSVAVRPRTKADLDKMSAALPRLCEEDPSLQLRRDADTNETLLSGLGETHLEVAAEKLQRKFGAGVNLDPPKLPYKETISAPAQSEYKHKKQTGGHGQYGHVLLRMEPLERNAGFEFVKKIVGGAIPKNYIPAVEKGVLEAKQEGVVAGYPVVDVRVTLYDGSYHDVDSSDISFKIAAMQALKKGLSDGQPVLLEPILNLRVTVPENFTGDVISDLNTKRAKVQGMNREGNMSIVEAQVPQAEIIRYAVGLRSITQGRGSFVAEFSHYEEVPAFISQKVIAATQAEKQADKA